MDDDPPLLCGQALKKYRHVCAIFNSATEAREIVGDFVAEGCRRGHRTLALVNPELVHDTMDSLAERGVGLPQMSSFSLKTWFDTYLRDGNFTAESMVDFVATSMKAARDSGYPCVWAAGDMNWAGYNPENSLELIKYESQLNDLKPFCEEDTWVCFYDSNLFSGRVIADIIRAHPVVLLGRHVFENPCYTEPREFLAELAHWEHTKPPAHLKVAEQVTEGKPNRRAS